MKRFHHPFFALLLSLLLIGSQQAAFAHLLTHTQSGTEQVTQYQNDHSSLDGAAETCTTCIAFSGVGGGVPVLSSATYFASLAVDSYCLPLALPHFARHVVTCRARAPPLFL